MRIAKKLILSSLFVCSLFGLKAHETPVTTLKPIKLIPNFSSLHHPVSTKNFEAQRFFDQGLAFMYAFNHDAAYRSFRQAAELDPNLAMAYWGMALALGQNINTEITPQRQQLAYDHIQQALRLSSNATENEKAYIQALAKRYTNNPNPDLKQLAQQYSNAMQQVVQQFPEDLDAATLFGESVMDLNPWDLWTLDGEPKEGTLALVDTIESVLKRDPNHIGANHYYIHAVEASNHPERALISAERLSKLVPTSGHLLHMPSHIYLLVGDYQKAAAANEAAVQMDWAYIQENGMSGLYPLHYLSHNLYFLSRAYAMQGRFSDALRAAEQLDNFYVPHFKEMPDLEYYAPTVQLVLYRFNQWPKILKTPPPNSDMKMTTALWRFSRAAAFAALGQLDQANAEKELFFQAKEEIPPGAEYGYNQANAILTIAAYLLDAKLAEAQKQPEQAIKLLQQAVNVQDQLRYNEPPDWSFPIRESLGAMLFRNGQYQEAENVFRADLVKHPRNGRSLFGLLQSLKAQNKNTDAFWVQSQFDQAWKNADVPLNSTLQYF